MITDEMRRNAPICQKHGEQMELAENADDSEVAAYCRTCCVESKTPVDLSSRSMRSFNIVIERPRSIRFDWGKSSCIPLNPSIHREINGLVYADHELLSDAPPEASIELAVPRRSRMVFVGGSWVWAREGEETE